MVKNNFLVGKTKQKTKEHLLLLSNDLKKLWNSFFEIKIPKYYSMVSYESIIVLLN